MRSILLFKVFKAYGVSITQHTLERTIATHPEYPSMRCISDALDSWKIKHVVMKLSWEKLRALGIPVIAHLKRGEYAWITQITDSKVCYWSAIDNKHVVTHADFEQEWSGVALAFEDITDAGEPGYAQKHREEITRKIFRYATASIGILLWALLTCISWANDIQLPIASKICLLFINGAGLYLSCVLIKQEKRQSNRLVDKFCKSGKHIDCNQVTSSRYSKLFGWISWAELGTAYFASNLLWISIAPLSSGWASSLWWFSFIALPFTIWSLIVQAFVIRKWCLFCCSVVFLLWVNAVILTIYHPQPVNISIPDAALLVLLFLSCLFTVIELSKTSGSQERLYAQQRETARIKYDILTIQAQLSEIKYEIGNVGFVWGSLQSYDITLFVSIACSHCGKAVKELNQLTKIYPNINYRLIFAVYSDSNDESNTIIRHLISLYKTMHKDEFFDMLDTWYTVPDKKMETLQKIHPVSSVQNNNEELNALYQFSEQSKISYTPAILINGRLLSQLYSYQDLHGIARTLNAEE